MRRGGEVRVAAVFAIGASLLAGSTSEATAQAGTLTGMATDARSGAPIAGGSLELGGTSVVDLVRLATVHLALRATF